MGQTERTCPHCGSAHMNFGATGLDECQDCGGLSREGLTLRVWEMQQKKPETFEVRVEKLARHGYVGVSIAYSDEGSIAGEWIVGIHMGRKAPDSDMVGGAAYGVAPNLPTALESALSEAGV